MSVLRLSEDCRTVRTLHALAPFSNLNHQFVFSWWTKQGSFQFSWSIF